MQNSLENQTSKNWREPVDHIMKIYRAFHKGGFDNANAHTIYNVIIVLSYSDSASTDSILKLWSYLYPVDRRSNLNMHKFFISYPEWHINI